MDYEAGKGTYNIQTIPRSYVTWFDPDGPVNMPFVARNMNPKIPVLFVVPTNDYPNLLKTRGLMFGLLPRHGLTRLYEPRANHLGAPAASAVEITRWVTEVVNVQP